MRDCPDRSIKAIEAGDWEQAYNPNYVTLMVTDSCFNGYGKTNWCDLSDINNHDDDMAHVVEVPKPEANWERVSRSSNATAKRAKQRFMPSCTEECACETSNPWDSLNDEQRETTALSFLQPRKQQAFQVSTRGLQCRRSRAAASKGATNGSNTLKPKPHVMPIK